MHVSHETELQTSMRLHEIARLTEVSFFDDDYCFEEFAGPPAECLRPGTLAIVRDGTQWSQLVPVAGAHAPGERFRLWACHFPSHVDNSGFVGWLASVIKARTGSGVFVVCGHNAMRGGVFDYWGCPANAARTVLPCVRALLGPGPRQANEP